MAEKVLEHLELVHALIRSFDKSELAVLQKFLSAFESRQKGFKPKGVMLLDLIVKHDDPNEVLNRFRKKLGKDSLNAARMQINRLRDKAYECMALGININREGAVSVAARGQHQILTKRYVAQLLDHKGHRELSNRVLNQAIKLAKEFEFYSDLIELLYMVRERTRGATQLKEHEVVNKEIRFYQECQGAVWRSKDVIDGLSTMRVKLVSMTDPTGEFSKAISDSLPVLEEDFETTGSAKIGVNYYSFKCELLQMEHDYEAAIEPFNMWLDLVENNVSVRADSRLAAIHTNIGQNNTFSFKFDDALHHLKLAKEFISSESKMHYMIMQEEFYALYYKGELEASHNHSAEMVKAAEHHGFKNKGPQWNFFAAAAEYCTGNLKQARRFLLETGALRSDREGYNIAIRVFEIILDIDGEKFDVADSQINNLRQFIKEGLKGAVIRKRDELILQILLDLRRASYRFEDLEESTLDHWRELFGTHKEVNWIPECAELVPFHLWFSYKHQGIPYHPKLTSELIHTPYI